MSSFKQHEVAPSSSTIKYVRMACSFLRFIDVEHLRKIAEALGIEYVDGISVAVATKDLLCAGLNEDFKETKQQRENAKNSK